MIVVLSGWILALQGFRVGNTKNFSGFIPDRQTAIEVARPIFRKVMGEAYETMMEPLKADSVEGRWVVRGTWKTPLPSDEFIVEPYLMALDPWSGKVCLFGPAANIQLDKDLRRLKPDGPWEPKRASKTRSAANVQKRR